MQAQLEAEAPGAVVLLTVNATGFEAGNGGYAMGKTLPLLQDTPAVDAWGLWKVEYRDVVIIDGTGRRRAVFNLTDTDLNDPTNFASVKQVLLQTR
jgi:hypothetical protein